MNIEELKLSNEQQMAINKQFFITEKSVRIRLVNIKNSFYKDTPWEVYQLKGEPLFKGIERFSTKEKALERIRECLEK